MAFGDREMTVTGVDQAQTQSAPHHLQTAHGPVGSREPIGLHSHPLEHGDEEVRQRVIALLVEGKMLAVLETAAREENRKIGGEMTAGIPEI